MKIKLTPKKGLLIVAALAFIYFFIKITERINMLYDASILTPVEMAEKYR